MTTIQLPNQLIATDLKNKAAFDRFKELLFEFIDNSGTEPGINIDLFVEQITSEDEGDVSDFYIIDEDSVNNADITISEEDLDSIIDDYLEFGNTEDEEENETDDDDEEEEYIDEAEEKPELFDDKEDE
jgi:hypothetical protein